MKKTIISLAILSLVSCSKTNTTEPETHQPSSLSTMPHLIPQVISTPPPTPLG